MSRNIKLASRGGDSAPETSYLSFPSPETDDGSRIPRKTTRKPHRKSRFGCRNCKNRRVKCNEEKPQCSTCQRFGDQCDYATVLPSRPGDSSSPPNLLESNFCSPVEDKAPLDNLCISDIELTYHWSTATYQTLSVWSTGALKWRNVFVEVALEHHHVLYLIFSFTALHLAYSRPERWAEYVSRSDYYYSQALNLLTTELQRVDRHNSRAITTSAQLITGIGLAKGPQPGEYLAFSDAGEGRSQSEWLAMFRGVRTCRETIDDEEILGSSVSVVMNGRPVPVDQEPLDWERHLRELFSHVEYVAPEDTTTLKALSILIETYQNKYGGRHTEHHILFSWLYILDIAFLDQLQRRETLPLIVYAHFVVLLQAMERFWYMKGWTHHVMGGIWRALPLEERPWLDWPIEQVGWIPPS